METGGEETGCRNWLNVKIFTLRLKRGTAWIASLKLTETCNANIAYSKLNAPSEFRSILDYLDENSKSDFSVKITFCTSRFNQNRVNSKSCRTYSQYYDTYRYQSLKKVISSMYMYLYVLPILISALNWLNRRRATIIILHTEPARSDRSSGKLPDKNVIMLNHKKPKHTK